MATFPIVLTTAGTSTADAFFGLGSYSLAREREADFLDTLGEGFRRIAVAPMNALSEAARAVIILGQATEVTR